MVARSTKDSPAPTVEGEVPLPDMPEPPEPEVDGDPEEIPVHKAWARVMREVGIIAKSQRNADQNFNFRGVDQVINNVGPVLRKHGVFIVPETVLEIREERYESKRGTAMHAVLTHEVWRVYGPDGTSFTMQSVGQSADSGDKGVAKAQSVAYRVVLLQSLAIPTGDRDPDADSNERAGSADRRDERPPADEPAPPDPRNQLWADITNKGKLNDPPIDQKTIGADFRAWAGKAINGPTTSPQDLTKYYHVMLTAPAERTPYVDDTPAPSDVPPPADPS